ncbi:glycosyl hydrolase [Eubacteriales bacterium OttesenSCG-928-A19]|nr:glycosyl hydrolase [Eubacteriales bacterium OttesenSCG-928-A19]
MTRDYLQGKKCMVWSFMGNSRMFQALNNYGDRFEAVGIFTFEVDATGTITETGTNVAGIMPYIQKWPHVRWFLTIMNHGTAAIFTALRNNTNGAKDRFLTEIVRIMQKYPWCAGVDIDLERGGGYENRAAANALFRDIYSTVKAYSRSKLVNICLPGMTGVQGSVGGENWCVYADLNPYCDTAAIMSYGMAWAGSAPGPVSPRYWLEGIYDYATRVMTPSKVYMGLPAYGWNWRIHDTPENMGMVNRGVSNTYYAAQTWLNGGYNFTDDAPPQPFIPFVGIWDDYDKVPWALPHVYDYMEGWDSQSTTGPVTKDIYNRRRYLTCYAKAQRTSFGQIIVDRDGGSPDARSGNVIVGDKVTTLGADGTATFNFTVPDAGTYDVAVQICYPFWDKNGIVISLDGAATTFSENRLWWPYWRMTCWLTLAKAKALSAGQHSIVIRNGVQGSQFYGFRVCTAFSASYNAGEAVFDLHPRSFKDVDGNMAAPDKGFRLTTEVLRRKPDSALAWYEDFRDETPLKDTYYKTISGEWKVWKDPDSGSNRPYSQLEGQGQLTWNYIGFNEVHLRARIAFPANATGRAGVFIGNIFCCINIGNQCVELYQGGTRLGSWQGEYRRTPDADIRKNPSMYLLEFRKRGNSVRVYSGSSSTLRFTANVSATSGYAGIQSDGPIKCELLRLGDAWTYEPYEAVDVVMPDGSTAQYGRIQRNNAAWDNEFEVFRLTSDIEEPATRTEDISLDYDFLHSALLEIPCNQDYTAQVRLRDINLWVSRLFLGDADGFSILYYQDVDSLVYWSNEAAYRWKLRGIAIWSLGQEDLRLWEHLPRQI